ncbi:MAG: NTP transferase domain-containing protein [Treponema sp.]|jgi:spore coat polysaccharide biosynthesis protein SpsF|nr:NTP transferase domain-containing protein [Treponema sp.]
MTVLVLQARLDSKRLSGKSLLPLGGEPLVFRVMQQLSFLKTDAAILACPEDCKTEFAPLAKRAGFDMVTGPKEDVLARFCAVIRRYSPGRVIRATADNPFVFIDAARSLEQSARALHADYACFAGIPAGSGTESLAAAALLAAESEADKADEREHVAPFLYRHGERFLLHRPLAALRWQSPLSLTVDTQEDYERALALYDALKDNENKTKGAHIIAAAKICFGDKYGGDT